MLFLVVSKENSEQYKKMQMQLHMWVTPNSSIVYQLLFTYKESVVLPYFPKQGITFVKQTLAFIAALCLYSIKCSNKNNFEKIDQNNYCLLLLYK